MGGRVSYAAAVAAAIWILFGRAGDAEAQRGRPAIARLARPEPALAAGTARPIGNQVRAATRGSLGRLYRIMARDGQVRGTMRAAQRDDRRTILSVAETNALGAESGDPVAQTNQLLSEVNFVGNDLATTVRNLLTATAVERRLVSNPRASTQGTPEQAKLVETRTQIGQLRANEQRLRARITELNTTLTQTVNSENRSVQRYETEILNATRQILNLEQQIAANLAAAAVNAAPQAQVQRTAAGQLRRQVAQLTRQLAAARRGLAQVQSEGALPPDGVRAETLRARYLWVPMMTDRAARRVVVHNVIRDRAIDTARLLDGIAANPGDAELTVYDTILVGAGVHSATVAHGIHEADPAHRMLMLEASDVLGANFGLSGDVFAINSRNGQQTEDPLVQGRGNINPLEGPVQVTDLSGARWPSARTVAEATAISAHTAGARIALGAEVTAVARATPNPDGTAPPARYRITFRDRQGRVFNVFSNRVVVGTGLGTPRVTLGDPASDALIQETVSQGNGATDGTRGATLPRIATTEQLIRYAALSRTGRDLFRAASPNEPPPVTAIVGFGDSARVAAEWLTGRAPDETYDGDGRADRAQRGEVGTVDWIVGSNGPETCEEFLQGAPERNLNGVRDRYADLAGPIRADRLRLVRAQLRAIRRVAPAREGGPERFELSYALPDGQSTTRVVDRVILSTGFESRTAAVLQGVFPANQSPGTTPLESSPLVEVVRSGDGQGLAKRIVQEDVYLVGPAAGSTGIVPDTDLRRVDENRASIFNLGPRSARLGRDVIARVQSRVAGNPTTELLVGPPPALVQPSANDTPSAPVAIARVVDVPRGRVPVGRGALPLLVKSLAANALSQFRFAVPRVQLSVRRGGNGALELSAPGLAPEGVQELAKAFGADAELVDALEDIVTNGEETTITAGTRADGSGENAARVVRPGSIRVGL